MNTLNPKFESLQDPSTLVAHIKSLTDITVPKHAEILSTLAEQFEKVDFFKLAFPQAERLQKIIDDPKADAEEKKDAKKELVRLKLGNKHFLVLGVEQVLKIAGENNWGLCKNNDFIYLYNGQYWNEVDKETFQMFLGRAAEKMGIAKFSARFYLFKDQLFKQFLSTAYLPKPEPDPEVVLINLGNGTFKIGTKERKLRPFDKDDFLTYQLPFKYDPEAKAPLWQKYLNEVLPDMERQHVLGEFLGYIFIRHGSKALKEEKALILYGQGSNGKSVAFEIVSAMIGEANIGSYSLQRLTDDTGYFRAKLSNLLLNYASEINGSLETSIFKQLVSGEPVEARLPYGEPFILKQYAKLMFNCNELPRDVEHTHAYFRRFIIIPFDVTIPEERQDKNLHTKIIESELPGVFNWVLEGLTRLLENGKFSKCDAAKVALEQYKHQSDSVKLFVEEKRYLPDSTNREELKHLYEDYRKFCQEDGFKPLNKSNFKRRLEGAGFLIERKNVGIVVFLKVSDAQ